MRQWKKADLTKSKHALAHLTKVLARDEAVETPADAERIIKTWSKGGILSGKEGDALQRSIDQTQIAIMKGKVSL